MIILPQVRKMPFLRIVIPYMTGLIAGYYYLPPADVWIFSGACIVLFILFFILAFRSPLHFNHSWLAGTLVWLLFTLLGAVNILTVKYIKSHFLIQPETCFSRLLIIETPERKENSIHAVARIRQIYHTSHQKWIPVKVIIRFPRTPESELLRPGDMICLLGRYRPVAGPANPGEFDYRRFLSRQDIEYRIYADTAAWALTDHSAGNLKIIALHCRDHLLAEFRASPFGAQASAVLSALTLGYRNDLEAETTELFTRAGVIHIMALSGFNVGMIFLMLDFFLGFLRKRGFQGFVRLAISLIGVWTFAVITGLSSSVTRAGIMISLFLIGKFISRNANPVNIVSASAFLMLVFSPCSLFDAGFQLSFAAVLGIIHFQPCLYRLIRVNNRLADKIWILFTVSMAAQLTTAPLTLYYFHMFPLLFWITNLFVVPLVTLIIYISFPFLLFSFVTPVRILLARVLEFLVNVLTGPLAWLTGFPGSVAENIYVSKIQVVLLFAILILTWALIMQNRLRYRIAVLVLLFAFILSDCLRQYAVRQQQILTMNNIRGTVLLDILSGRKNLVMPLYGHLPDDKTLHYFFYNWWVEHGVESTGEIMTPEKFRENTALSARNDIMGKNLFLNISGTTFVVCTDDVFNAVESTHKLKADYIVITKAIRPDIRKLLKHFTIGTVILDQGVGRYELLKWTGLCRENRIDCWPGNERGAFVLKQK
jgi:competence protein ComEC